MGCHVMAGYRPIYLVKRRAGGAVGLGDVHGVCLQMTVKEKQYVPCTFDLECQCQCQSKIFNVAKISRTITKSMKA